MAIFYDKAHIIPLLDENNEIVDLYCNTCEQWTPCPHHNPSNKPLKDTKVIVE